MRRLRRDETWERFKDRTRPAPHGNDPEVKPLWDALYAADAEVVINGHDHDYERFAPQDPTGKPDAQRGIREFVVGTGGKNSHRTFASPQAQ